MKKLMILSLAVIALLGSVNVSLASGNKEVIGSWKYEAPTAPYGYEKGTIVFSEKEGKIVGEVKFADGYKIDMKNVSYENNEVKCGLYVDYEQINVNLKIDGKKMTGVAKTPEGDLKITGEKQ
jgi:hypothetical protein